MRISDWSSDVCSSDLVKSAFNWQCLICLLRLMMTIFGQHPLLEMAVSRCTLKLGLFHPVSSSFALPRMTVRGNVLKNCKIPVNIRFGRAWGRERVYQYV